MSRVSEATVKRLFAVSRNRCAFPKCEQRLVDEASRKVTGEICHIKARKAGGPRYDALQTEEQRNSFENLVLMCPTHHVVIDADEESYSVERLSRLKTDAVQQGESTPIDVPSFVVHALIASSEIRVDAGSLVMIPGQFEGQLAHSITNVNYQQPTSLNPQEEAVRQHDVRIFREADSHFSEEKANELFDHLAGGHEHRFSETLALNDFTYFLSRVSNEFIDPQLREVTSELLSKLEALHNFIALHFFDWPEKQNREDLKYCLHPYQCIDRAGSGTPEEIEMYDRYAGELRELVSGASAAYISYRRKVKLTLFE